jgi:hypothetical protein
MYEHGFGLLGSETDSREETISEFVKFWRDGVGRGDVWTDWFADESLGSQKGVQSLQLGM